MKITTRLKQLISAILLALGQIHLCLSAESKLKTSTKTHTHTSTATATNLQTNFKMTSSFFMSEKLASKLDLSSSQTISLNTKSQDGITSGNIRWEGWVSFFKYDKNAPAAKRPKSFFINHNYFRQMYNSNIKDLEEKLNGRFRFIPTETSFYAVLRKRGLLFVSSREDMYNSNEDVMNLDDVIPIPEDDLTRGGIKNFGAFTEGYCLRVSTQLDLSGASSSQGYSTASRKASYEWVICTKDPKDKDSLMASLQQATINIQHANGIVYYNKTKRDKASKLLESINGIEEKRKRDELVKLSQYNTSSLNQTVGIVDGYWYTFQDWTNCSLICGGGKSYFQRICIPPRNGGRPCQGDSILTKDCNTQACQSRENTIKTTIKPNSSNRSEISLRPIYQNLPLMTRPQQYIKCKIKESDLLMPLNGEITGDRLPSTGISKLSSITDSLPVRVVMNNRTISIYSSHEYMSEIKTFDLQLTSFFRSKRNSQCFILRETISKKAELCPFQKGNILDEWSYDFSLFKTQCQNGNRLEADENKLRKDLQSRLKKAQDDSTFEREKEIEKQLALSDEENVEMSLKRLNRQSKLALVREIKLEEDLKREEEEKMVKEQEEIESQIKKEEEKGKRIMQAIEEKQMENQLNLKARLSEQEASSITAKTSDEILQSRTKLKRELQKIKERGLLKKQSLQNKLLNVKIKLSEGLGESLRKGNAENCRKAMDKGDEIESYCTLHFADDWDAFLSCKKLEDFCFVCCDTEFGGQFVEEKDKCVRSLCYGSSPGFKGVSEDRDEDDGASTWTWRNNG